MNKTILYFMSILFVIPFVTAQNTTGIMGTVADSLNNLVDGAEVQGYCGLTVVQGETDKFGTFVFTDLPTGHCTFYARFKDSIGFSNVAIENNKIKEVNLKLDKTVVSITKKTHVLNWILTGIIVFIFIIGMILFLKNKTNKVLLSHQQKENKNKKASKQNNNTKRLNVLFKALSDREKQIVEQLIKHGQCTQAKIRYETGMPKVTLSRHIAKLEAKKIIQVERIGKFSKIKLSKDWTK